MTRHNITLDDVSNRAMSDLPRRISVSAIVRVCLSAVMTTDKHFDEYLKKNPEALEVKEWLKPKLQKLLR